MSSFIKLVYKGFAFCRFLRVVIFYHKKLDLKSVKVELTHDKVHVTDGDPKNKGGKIDQIKRMIKIEGNLTNDQRDRLIEIANKCPVHKTIESNPIIITQEI